MKNNPKKLPKAYMAEGLLVTEDAYHSKKGFVTRLKRTTLALRKLQCKHTNALPALRLPYYWIPRSCNVT